MGAIRVKVVPDGAVMTEQEILEILADYIEASTTAMDVLKAAGYIGDRKRVVADVLRRGSVPQPPEFPGSRGCIIFGRAIAKYIMSQERKPT